MDEVIGELTEVSNTLSGEHYFILSGMDQKKLMLMMTASIIVGGAIVEAGKNLHWYLARKRVEREENQ